MAVRDPDGYVRIVGRKATDLIKSGGYKIGAGEIENALLEHPGVARPPSPASPTRTWASGSSPGSCPADPPVPAAAERAGRPCGRASSPRTSGPRVVRFLDALPRNDMGKIMKRALP